MQQMLEFAITQSLGDCRKIVSIKNLNGGCINRALHVLLEDGQSFLIKLPMSKVPVDHFEVEADGLNALSKPACIQIPKVYGQGVLEDGNPYLILEFIQPASQGSDFQAALGSQLANLHKQTASDSFGWHCDNYIGSTLQPNAWSNDWVDFYRTHRLGYQLKLAQQNGLVDSSFMDLARKLLDKLDDIIGIDEPACLLHGDLWGGNVMCGKIDSKIRPVLIDPAVYMGHREADLAMTRLFGGFTADFYESYHKAWPLPASTLSRQNVYMLYHLLNHLNLFGRGYFGQCFSLMKQCL